MMFGGAFKFSNLLRAAALWEIEVRNTIMQQGQPGQVEHDSKGVA